MAVSPSAVQYILVAYLFYIWQFVSFNPMPISIQPFPLYTGVLCGCLLVAQLCPALWDSIDCSLPGSSVHGISQVRTLEWVAISFSRESVQPRDWTCVFCISGRFFTFWATREAPSILVTTDKPVCSLKLLLDICFIF